MNSFLQGLFMTKEFRARMIAVKVLDVKSKSEGVIAPEGKE